MTNNLKKLCSLVACLLLLAAPVLTSCAESKANTDAEATTAAEETTINPEETVILPDLPDVQYDGYNFVFLARMVGGSDWVDWQPRDIVAEEQTGEVINDSIVARNLYIQETYNVTIEQQGATDKFDSFLTKAINSGDAIYDAVQVGLGDSANYALKGYFTDLKEVPYLDLEKPWWDQKANAELSMGGKLFMTCGDIFILGNDATSAMVFNKKLVSDFNLDSPYQLVEDGKWTFPKLKEMTLSGVASDLNGDGKMYIEDRYGLLFQRDSLISFFHASGEKVAQKDEEDLPYLTFGTERVFDVFSTIYDCIYNQDVALNVHLLEGKMAIYAEEEKMFMDDRGLFMWLRMRVVENLRGMNSDFGIIPVPKYDESQDGYYHTANKYTGVALAVPLTNPDLERTGVILEALAAKSKYTLQPAYYEIALQGKYARDTESETMLDLIFSTRVYDLGEIYNFGDLGGVIWETMTFKTDIASFYAKREKTALANIEKFKTTFEAMENQ